MNPLPSHCRCGYDHAKNDRYITHHTPDDMTRYCRNCRVVYSLNVDELASLPDIGLREAELENEVVESLRHEAKVQAEEDALNLKQSTCEHDYQQHGFIQFCLKCNKRRPFKG